MQNAIDLLKADHDRMRQILGKIADERSLSGEQREKFLRALEKEVKIHTLIEEEIFYAAFKEAAKSEDDRDMYYEAIEEHHVVDMLLPELIPLDGSTPAFRAKARVLREMIEHHADEEEIEMFEKARALFGDARLMEIGIRMRDRRNDLEAQWESRFGSVVRRAQSVADKFMPTKMKDLRADLGRRNETR